MDQTQERWSTYDPVVCQEETRPSESALMKNSRSLQQGLYKLSTHPWCIGCYSLYVSICKNVADAFVNTHLPLDKDKQEFKAVDFMDAVAQLLARTDLNLPQVEKALSATLDCINARRFHHHSCYKRTKKFHDMGAQNADASHTSFLIVLCNGVKRMWSRYESLLAGVNEAKRYARQQPIVSLAAQEKYKNTLYVCSNLLHTNEIEDDQSGEVTPLTHMLKLKHDQSRRRTTRHKKIRSRRKREYKPVFP